MSIVTHEVATPTALDTEDTDLEPETLGVASAETGTASNTSDDALGRVVRLRRALGKWCLAFGGTAAVILTLLGAVGFLVEWIGNKFDSNIAANTTAINALENKMDAKIDRLEDKVNAKIDRLEDKVDAEIDRLEDKVDAGFEKIDDRFEKIDDRFEKIDDRMDGMAKDLAAVLAILSHRTETVPPTTNTHTVASEQTPNTTN